MNNETKAALEVVAHQLAKYARYQLSTASMIACDVAHDLRNQFSDEDVNEFFDMFASANFRTWLDGEKANMYDFEAFRAGWDSALEPQQQQQLPYDDCLDCGATKPKGQSCGCHDNNCE